MPSWSVGGSCGHEGFEALCRRVFLEEAPASAGLFCQGRVGTGAGIPLKLLCSSVPRCQSHVPPQSPEELGAGGLRAPVPPCPHPHVLSPERVGQSLYDNVAEPRTSSPSARANMTVRERTRRAWAARALPLHGRQGIVPGNRLKILVGMHDKKPAVPGPPQPSLPGPAAPYTPMVPATFPASPSRTASTWCPPPARLSKASTRLLGPAPSSSPRRQADLRLLQADALSPIPQPSPRPLPGAPGPGSPAQDALPGAALHGRTALGGDEATSQGKASWEITGRPLLGDPPRPDCWTSRAQPVTFGTTGSCSSSMFGLGPRWR